MLFRSGTAARDLADDLAAFLPEGSVGHFPAWETLPFERVSPAVRTMGERTRLLWRLRTPGEEPRIVVAGVRALLQKLAPGWDTIAPVEVRRGAALDLDIVCETLVSFGYRRENVVEHRGEFARADRFARVGHDVAHLCGVQIEPAIERATQVAVGVDADHETCSIGDHGHAETFA